MRCLEILEFRDVEIEKTTERRIQFLPRSLAACLSISRIRNAVWTPRQNRIFMSRGALLPATYCTWLRDEGEKQKIFSFFRLENGSAHCTAPGMKEAFSIQEEEKAFCCHSLTACRDCSLTHASLF